MNSKIGQSVKIVSIVAVCLLIFTMVNSTLVFGIEVFVDDEDATFVGSWNYSTGVPGYFGSGYRTNYAASGSDTATWEVDIPTEGSWEVFVRWTSYSSRGTNVPYTVNHKLGSNVVRVNQQLLNGVWFSLGVYSFDAGIASVVMSNDADGSVCADAIRIVEVVPPLTEPIEVILDEPIDVTLDEPIDVTLDEPIEVTGETMRGKISTLTVAPNQGTIFDPLEERTSLIGVEGYKVAHVWFYEFSGQVQLQILNKMNTFVGSFEIEEEVVAPTNTNGVYTVELTGNLLQINLENTAAGTPSFPVYLYVYLLTG
ncbi:MAG: hypothetical protein P8X97_04915 [Candidatus Bathyarchaeota archaeon]